MIIVRPYSLWPVRSASELLLAAVIWPYFRKVILYYIEEPQFYRYTFQYTILRREKGGNRASWGVTLINDSLNYYNERRSTYTHRVAEWNDDDNDDIIVVVVHCCFFLFFFFVILILFFIFFLSSIT